MPKAMREVILKVPEERYDFVMELIENLGLEVENEIEIPEWHKNVLNERLEQYSSNPSEDRDADDALDDIERTL